MKKTMFLGYFTMLLLVLGCSDDDSSTASGNGPTADFSFSNDESTFSFTNLSKNATSYQWDFVDLNFYTHEENTTYIYSKEWKITVSLTGNNEAGQNDFIAKKIQAPEIIIIDISMDGESQDWEDVELAEEDTTGTGSIQKVK